MPARARILQVILAWTLRGLRIWAGGCASFKLRTAFEAATDGLKFQGKDLQN